MLNAENNLFKKKESYKIHLLINFHKYIRSNLHHYRKRERKKSSEKISRIYIRLLFDFYSELTKLFVNKEECSKPK